MFIFQLNSKHFVILPLCPSPLELYEYLSKPGNIRTNIGGSCEIYVYDQINYSKDFKSLKC